MVEKFGKTGWGEHWLHSLENVDYSNHLPCGLHAQLRPYQRQGS